MIPSNAAAVRVDAERLQSAQRRGISPSPHALSTGSARGSTTVTSKPRRRASIAATNPTGPPPATSTSVSYAVTSRTEASAAFSVRIRTVSRPAFSTVNTSAVTHAVWTSGSAKPSTTTAT